MSNDDSTPPPPPPPPPPNGDPTPESGIGGLAEPPAGDPFAPTEAVGTTGRERPDVDSTQVMPVVPTLPTATPTPAEPVNDPTASGMVPTGPNQTLPPEAWYRRPGAIAGILLGLFVVAGVILFFVFTGGDDDADGVIEDLAPDAVSLVVTRLGSGGQPLDTALSATVTVQEPAADAYTWVIPSDASVGQAGLRETDSTGRAEFRWAPSDVATADTWTSTVEVSEFIAPEGGRAVTDLAVDCTLERDGSTEDIVVDATVRSDEPVGSPDSVGNYSFPNLRLAAGDRVTCTSTNILADIPPPISEPATTVLESTTVPETTTTVAETTTTVAETTTTTTTTTVPPAEPEIGEFLQDRPELSEAFELLERVGLLEELEALDEPFTIFLPTNDALEDVQDGADPPDFDDDDTVRALFEAHLVVGEALDSAAIADRESIEVVNGDPQPVDASADPIEIGGIPVSDVDDAVDNAVDGGIVHVLDGVLPIQP